MKKYIFLTKNPDDFLKAADGDIDKSIAIGLTQGDRLVAEMF